MAGKVFRIAVVAPASRIEPAMAERVRGEARKLYGARVDIFFHPQCYLTDGHFAGNDAARAAAFLDVANDPSFDAVWAARGGYGSNRIAAAAIAGLRPAAKDKIYLGYSDIGFLLAVLYKHGCKVAHGPVAADIKREGGEVAIARALRFLVERDPGTLELSLSGPSAAFNLTTLGHLLGTPLEPDLAGHVLMLEDVDEHMYRLDRALFHLTANPRMKKLAGIRLGRVSAIPPNEPEFGLNEEDVARHWCAASGIAYLGRADIGHDIANKVVPFGVWR